MKRPVKALSMIDDMLTTTEFMFYQLRKFEMHCNKSTEKSYDVLLPAIEKLQDAILELQHDIETKYVNYEPIPEEIEEG